MTEPEFVVAIDTREQKPYRFPRSEVKTLATGDYSIVGLEDQVTVERKRLEELYTVTGRDRCRFTRELDRMARLDYAALVIETDVPRVLRGIAFSRVSPKAVIHSLIAWSVRYRVFVFFAGDRRHANAMTYGLLEQYWRDHDDTMNQIS